MGRVDGKIAIVTGGASGIGRATAKLLAAEGARIIITDVNAERGAEAAEEIGGEARFLPQDVSSEEEWPHVLKTTVDAFGGLDILVNAAGIGGTGEPQDPENVTLEEWRRINSVNLEGVFLGCKYAMKVMRESGGGAIVNISSLAAMVATAPISAYGAGKAGVRQFTKSVALHCARAGYGIRCNSVHPGVIDTPMVEAMFLQAGDDREKIKSSILRRIPLGRLGKPEDVAYMVLYLASEESGFVTGAEFVIDGGMSIY